MNSEVITLNVEARQLYISEYRRIDLYVPGVSEENFYVFSVRGLSPDLNLAEIRVLSNCVIRIAIENNSGKNLEEQKFTVSFKRV